MSLNNSHYGATNGILLYNGEIILIYYDGAELALEPATPQHPMMHGNKKGRVYLTSHRVVFINKERKDLFQSWSMPFFCMRSLEIEQPVFGANYIKGEVKAEPQGRWEGTAKFKLWFNHGGAIEFGQCLLNAGRLADQARAIQNFMSQQQQFSGGNVYPAPPPAYTTLSAQSYGWVPTDRFPERPAGDSVFMYDQPPPYPGVNGQPQAANVNQFGGNVASGFYNPNDPNKVYATSNASAPPPDYSSEKPPSYDESAKKKM